MSDFKYIGKNIVCEPYTFRSSITASNITASGIIYAKKFVGSIDSASVSVSSSYALTASYALNGGSGGTSLTTGSTYPITASWSISSSYAVTSSISYIITSSYSITSSYIVSSSFASSSINSLYALSSSFASSSISSSYALSSSYSLTSSYALNAGTKITTGSTYPITSSWSLNTISSSYALTASYALNSGTSLGTGSTYPITASWSNNAVSSSYSLTASYALNAGGTSLTTGSTYPITSSWSIYSISSSWSENAVSSSYSLSSSYSSTALSSAFAYSSSWAATASYFSGSISDAISSSYSLSGSYALTASYALNGGSGGGIFVATSSVININFSSSVDKFVTDGINNTYTLTLPSNNPNELLVFLDGLEQEPVTDYTVSGTTFTLTSVPPPNLELEVRKFYSATTIDIITSSLNAQYFTGNGVTTQYILTRSVSNDYDVLVSFDGLIQKPTYDYTVTGSILNFTSPPPVNIDGEIRYLMGSTTGLISSGSGGTSLTTGSTYPITSSWATNTATASYLNPLNQIIILPTVSSSLNFVDDASAAAGGVPLGGVYRNGNFILIRMT